MTTLKSFAVKPIDSVKSKLKANNFAEFEARPDIENWRDFKDGNSDVLIYMYHQYVPNLLRFGLQFAPREIVKDSIQDLFLYLKEKKSLSNDVKNISAYLYKSLYRILKKKVNYSVNLTSVDLNKEVKNWKISISREVKMIELEDLKEQKNKLNNSLEDLSAKQRQALLLYYYEGFTHTEITDIMQLKNKSSVRKLIYRALDSLKESFSI